MTRVVSSGTTSNSDVVLYDGSSVVDFAGDGHLVLDNAQAWPIAATFSGFGVPGDIDCQDINIATASLGYATTSVGGILTVSDGTHTAQLALIGNYSLGSFQKVNDGHGGTLISDPPVSSGQAIAAPSLESD